MTFRAQWRPVTKALLWALSEWKGAAMALLWARAEVGQVANIPHLTLAAVMSPQQTQVGLVPVVDVMSSRESYQSK